MIIGIDPGLKGAFAFLSKKGKVKEVIDMPQEAKITGKGFQVSALMVCEILRDKKVTMAYVERVHAMPGQGVVSVFSFGRSMGVVETALAAFGIPVTFVTPHAWKKRAGLIGKEKDASRTLCLSLYPGLANELKYKKNVDRADAILIALHGK